MWIAISIATIIVSLLAFLYLIKAVSRFGLISKINPKWLKNLVAALIIVLCFAGFTIALGVVNAMVILVYVLAFFVISGIIVRIIQKITGKTSAIYLQGWLAIIISIIHLSCAYYLCHNVWRTEYNLSTDKAVNGLHMALIADSHLGTTFGGEGFAKWMKQIESDNPDLLLIAGDYVDNSSKKADMIRACEALGDMNLKYGVYFAYGNHDKHAFGGRDFSVEDLENELIKNGVHILEDEFIELDNLSIVGRKDFVTEKRQDISDLLKNVDEDKYIVVIDHEPTDYENECESPADVVVSGHTHGGQLLAIKYFGEWSGINDRTYGYERRNKTDFIVTSGISDWALDFKTGTKSEYVMINVN